MKSLTENIEELIITQNTKELVRVLEEHKGKKFVIDIAELPTSLSIDQWYYYFNSLGILFIDSRNEK